MTLFSLTKRPFTSTSSLSLSSATSFHGSHHHYSTTLCSAYSAGRLRRQRGVLFFRWQQQQQVCFLQGSSVPLSRFHQSSFDCCVHRFNCQVSSYLSSSIALPDLQERLLDSKLRGCNLKNFEHGFSISVVPNVYFVRSMSFSVNYGVSFGGLLVPVCNSNWILPKFGGSKKVGILGFGGCYRGFSSCEEERESDGEDDEEREGSEGTFESSADPEEVSRVAKLIGELFALDRNMEAVLSESGIELSHDLVVDVLRRFKHARKPAFRFFCWAGQRPGFSHDSRTYNAMLLILGKTRQFETMGSLLEEMGEKGLLDMESFMIAIKAYAAGKERKKAVGVFELMKNYGFKVGVETINCMLDALAREKMVKEAQALYDRLKSRFTPNMKTYSVLLNGWCRVKNLMEAGKIWNEMIDQGLKPDLITHNIMLDGLLKVNKKSDAVKLFEVMKAKGPTPNVRSYTILIRDLCKHSKLREAVAYFDEMMASGCEPDAGVYTCLITGFGNIKKMDMVFGLLKEMKEKGYPPDGQLYNALIKLMTNRRMPDDAVRIYKKMIQNEIQPTIHTYNMMMKSYFIAGNSEMACAVWDEMVQRGCCPDENSYTVLIGGLIRQGRSEEACKHVEEMINKGMKVPELDFNRFAADFSKVGRPNILEELARKMRLSGNSEVSEVFARWAQMTQKRGTRRGTFDPDA
ncbi:pentatricopeptide repeat-containing protein At3g62470, mitochondrial-like [Chenopodium quinoa]|uniref:pentatricopeptide repeat-containing protein At3g62470, mitochondrial-like n=1 Tax=Chenopodium quinoa TaxID=63459 RepID=UPI000B799795|nr:pentatricopeptide repeat-containing protein At3g62470, mitochondrial-like [Chenopodium quinoa]